MCKELCQNVFRAQNKFEEEDFLQKKYVGLAAIIKMRPVEACGEITNRMLDEESSVGEKIMIIECLSNAAVQLSNTKQSEKSESILIDQFKLQQKKDNDFFGIKSIYDDEIKPLGTIVR